MKSTAAALLLFASAALAQHVGHVMPGAASSAATAGAPPRAASSAEHENKHVHDGLPKGGVDIDPRDGAWILPPETGMYKLSGDLFIAKTGTPVFLTAGRFYYVKPYKVPLMWIRPDGTPAQVPQTNLYRATVVNPAASAARSGP